MPRTTLTSTASRNQTGLAAKFCGNYDATQNTTSCKKSANHDSGNMNKCFKFFQGGSPAGSDLADANVCVHVTNNGKTKCENAGTSCRANPATPPPGTENWNIL